MAPSRVRRTLDDATKQKQEQEEPTKTEKNSNKDKRLLEKRGRKRSYPLSPIGRYGARGPVPTVNVCPSQYIFRFSSWPYPSTSNEDPDGYFDDSEEDMSVFDPNPSSAANMPGVGIIHPPPILGFDTVDPYNADGRVYISSQNPGTDGECPRRIWTFQSQAGNIWDEAASVAYYHTEHVLELHIVKDFLTWLILSGQFTCQNIYNDFGPGSSAKTLYGYPLTQVATVADELMLHLSWFDSSRPNFAPALQHMNEFFVLEDTLNLLKGKIMHGRPLHEPEFHSLLLPVPTSWEKCIEAFDQVLLVMEYLKQPEVINAWVGPRTRIYEYLDDPLLKQNLGGTNYAALWYQFLRAWVGRRQSDLHAWWQRTSTTCVVLGMNDPTWCSGQMAAAHFFYPGSRWSIVNYDFPAAYTP
jgi:hypothetical protein